MNKPGANTIRAAMEAMASVKKMDIDPDTGRVLSRQNKSILEDAYQKSNKEIPVEVKKIVENQKEVLKKTMGSSVDTVAAYYAMINGTNKEQILEEEQTSKIIPTNEIKVQKKDDEDAYMASIVAQINKRR